MTVDEFFAWQESQSERYELVDGQPLRMMAGAKNVHDDIVVNLVGELREQVRGSGCRPFTGDGSVEPRPGQIRRPDVGVDCGPRDPDGTKAALPKLVVEVQFDHFTGGRFRHGTKFLRWRPEKSPKSCTMRQVRREDRSALDLL